MKNVNVLWIMKRFLGAFRQVPDLTEHAAIRSALCILHFTFCILHSAQAQTLVGNWVGVRQEIDSGLTCPFPAYLQVRADSTYTLSLIDNAATVPRARWSQMGGQLRLDTAVYKPGYVELDDRTLRLRGYVPMTFQRVRVPEKSVDVEAIRAMLTNRICKLTNPRYVGRHAVHYHFHEGGRLCIEQHDGNRAVRCWAVVERDGAVFIVIKGNQTDCSRNYGYPMQVTGKTNTKLFVSRVEERQKFAWELVAVGSLPPGPACEAVGFQRCTDCLNATDEQADLLHKKGPPGRFYALRERLLADVPTGSATQTGLVQVRCWVNCEGRAGDFRATTYGPDYQPAPLDPALTKPILTTLQTHFATGWQPGRLRKVDRPLDYEAVINIRLVAGRITDVFP
jgi:hypothetical protein